MHMPEQLAEKEKGEGKIWKRTTQAVTDEVFAYRAGAK
jgi:hypothetical protein